MRYVKIIFLLLLAASMLSCAGGEIKVDEMPTARAADFSLADQDGKTWTLSETLKNYRGVVLAFYPKDNTGV
jgi:hypothetical protein